MVPVVLLATAFLVAGCGSQQASPLSVGKTEQAFAAAGIHLRPWPTGGNELVTFQAGGKERGNPLAAMLFWRWGHWNGTGGGWKPPSLVLVYRTVADAVHSRLWGNPSLYRGDTRIQNVVISAHRGLQDPRLRAALRHLKPSA